MYNIRLLGVGTMNPPVQSIYINKNEKREATFYATLVAFRSCRYSPEI
jgi:hypothetical protein